MERCRELFETWCCAQFNKPPRSCIFNRNPDGSYSNETVNTMWIGFSARDALLGDL